jgi:hypothetical protein
MPLVIWTPDRIVLLHFSLFIQPMIWTSDRILQPHCLQSDLAPDSHATCTAPAPPPIRSAPSPSVCRSESSSPLICADSRLHISALHDTKPSRYKDKSYTCEGFSFLLNACRKQELWCWCAGLLPYNFTRLLHSWYPKQMMIHAADFVLVDSSFQ